MSLSQAGTPLQLGVWQLSLVTLSRLNEPFQGKLGNSDVIKSSNLQISIAAEDLHFSPRNTGEVEECVVPGPSLQTLHPCAYLDFCHLWFYEIPLAVVWN